MRTLFINTQQIAQASKKLNDTTPEQFICQTRRAYPILDFGLQFQGGVIAGLTVSIDRKMQLPAWDKLQADFTRTMTSDVKPTNGEGNTTA